MRIAIFTGSSTFKFEREVNEWISNDRIKIDKVLFSVDDGTLYLLVFYEHLTNPSRRNEEGI